MAQQASAVQEGVAAGAAAESQVQVCAHHWVIQPANGPFSSGVCRVCGEARDFKNYIEAGAWGDSRLAAATPSPFPVEEILGPNFYQTDEE